MSIAIEPDMQPSFTQQLRLAAAFVWRVLTSGPVEFAEVLMAGQVLWFGLGLLLPVPSFSVRGLFTPAVEPYVGAWFVVVAFYKLAAIGLERASPPGTPGMVYRAAALILFSWTVIALYYRSLNPWSSAMFNSAWPVLVQGILFMRRAAHRGP